MGQKRASKILKYTFFEVCHIWHFQFHGRIYIFSEHGFFLMKTCPALSGSIYSGAFANRCSRRDINISRKSDITFCGS